VILAGVTFTATWWLTPVKPYATLKASEGCQRFLFSPDSSMLVTAGKPYFGEGPIRVWDVAGGFECFSLNLDANLAETVVFSPDGRLLAAQDRLRDITLWNARTGEEVATMKLGPDRQSWMNFRFSPDGRFLVFQFQHDTKGLPGKSYITFWNIESQKEQGTIEEDFKTLTFAPDGESFATLRQQEGSKIIEVLFWKMAEAPVLVKQHKISAKAVVFAPDLKTFVAADDLPDGNGEVAIRDMVSGEKVWSSTFNEHGTPLQSIHFEADGKILGAEAGDDWRGRTTLWDVTSTPKEIGSFKGLSPAVSPDGQWLACGVKLVKASAPDHEAHLIVKGDAGPSTSWFSPDSKMVMVYFPQGAGEESLLGKWFPQGYDPFPASPGGSVLRVWETGSLRHVLTLADCSEVLFSPDGKVLATLPHGQAVDLWAVPLRPSLWPALGWAGVVWLALVSVYWLSLKTWKKLVS
jgi:WD40 repeat protein